MDIVIDVRGVKYRVDEQAAVLNRIVLPDNTVVEAEAWQDSSPIGLHAIHPKFEDVPPATRATMIGGVLARRVK